MILRYVPPHMKDIQSLVATLHNEVEGSNDGEKRTAHTDHVGLFSKTYLKNGRHPRKGLKHASTVVWILLKFEPLGERLW